MAAWQEEAEHAVGARCTRRCFPGVPGIPASAAREIVRFARERGHDLLVVGTHGRRGVLERLVLGSVAQSVVREAPCSVLVVRIPASAKPEDARRA